MLVWEVIGWIGSALLIFSILQTRVIRFRVLNFAASVILVAFNAAIGVWSMAVMNFVLAAINVWYLRILLAQRHDEAAFEVIEVQPDDEYLRYWLRQCAADILKFQPDFVWDHADPDNLAFLVLRGDRHVGVMLLRSAGDTAEVLLDYVSPEFRDYSPGEFVWKRSGMLSRHGFRRVITPAAMVAPYYERIGFRPHEGRYVLDIPQDGGGTSA